MAAHGTSACYFRVVAHHGCAGCCSTRFDCCLAAAAAAAAVPCRYITWKHSSLLHLDHGAALFGLLYLAVMLRRLLQEPTTLFYFCIILAKVLPHVPLMLGFKQQFLRWV
jgi:hypothetical protein